MTTSPSTPRHLHFITGKLAAPSLRRVVDDLAKTLGFHYSIGVLPITVAALMTPRWVLRHFDVPPEATEVWLPGFVGDELDALRKQTSARVVLGPKDLRDLPTALGAKKSCAISLEQHSIEIIAEINHANRLSLDELLHAANKLRAGGADLIDVGCQPGQRWDHVGDAVANLVRHGHRVSIDSFDPWEVQTACRAGAELVLSVNSQNAHHAAHWDCEVVAIPDTPDDLDSLRRTVGRLREANVPFRLDPILEPIGCGFAASLLRYHAIRTEYPDVKMMMGIGNLTELTDVDSAGLNLLLLGICQEWRIDSVLTTQVINWARSSVAECDRARRLVHYAITQQTPPKRVDNSLVMLRDAKLNPHPPDTFTQLAQAIRDNNYRIFAQDEELHLVSAGLHLQDDDPFRLFDQLLAEEISDNVDVSHAFYLGYELAKAKLALQLGKQYEQDRALDWGILTEPEDLHRLARGRRSRKQNG